MQNIQNKSYYRVLKQENGFSKDDLHMIHFDGEINNQNFRWMVNELNNTPYGTHPYIYFSGRGGNGCLVSAFVDLFNIHQPTLVATDYLASATLWVFLNSNVPRKVLSNVECLHHPVQQEIHIHYDQKGQVVRGWGQKQLSKEFVSSELCKNVDKFVGVSPEEKDLMYKHNLELVFGAKRLQQAVKRSEEYFNNKM